MKGNLRVGLEIEGRDKNGEVIKRTCKDRDMILDNFKLLFLSGLLGEAADVPTKNEAGGAQTICGNIVHFGDAPVNYALHTAGRVLAIGTGTTAPARTDYCLETKVDETTLVSKSVGADYVQFYGALAIAAGADITEAGLFLMCHKHIEGNWQATAKILMFRDTFDPITVPPLGTITMTYTIYV